MEAMDVSPSYVDGGEFTSEVASTMRRCFDHFDADGDGALSHAEFSGVYQCECAAAASAASAPVTRQPRVTGMACATILAGRWLAACCSTTNLYVCVWLEPMHTCSPIKHARNHAHTQTLNRQSPTHTHTYTYIPSPPPPPTTHTHTFPPVLEGQAIGEPQFQQVLGMVAKGQSALSFRQFLAIWMFTFDHEGADAGAANLRKDLTKIRSHLGGAGGKGPSAKSSTPTSTASSSASAASASASSKDGGTKRRSPQSDNGGGGHNVAGAVDQDSRPASRRRCLADSEGGGEGDEEGAGAVAVDADASAGAPSSTTSADTSQQKRPAVHAFFQARSAEQPPRKGGAGKACQGKENEASQLVRSSAAAAPLKETDGPTRR